MPKSPKLSVTLKRGLIGRTEKVRNAVRSLGLRKIHHTVVREDTPQVRGMIFLIKHMVEVKKG